MTLFFADLVREASFAVGAGDLALGGALPGHRRFADAVPPGARFHYCIAGVTQPDEWETGEGQIGSGDTLVRLPLASSSGGAAVAFSAGLKTIALTVAAAWFEDQEAGSVSNDDIAALEASLADKAPLAGASFTGPVSAPSLTLVTSLAVGDGGTGGSSAAEARANLGLQIGTDVAAQDATLAALAGLDAAPGLIEQTGADSFAKRAIGTGAAASLITRGDGDGRYASAAHAHAIADVAGLQAGLDAKAPAASPSLTGTPTAPTPPGGTNDTQLATTAFVRSEVAALVGAAPAALDTLNELAASLGNDPNFAAATTSALAGKQPLDAELSALAALTGAADKLPYFTGPGVAALADFSAYGRSLADDADAAAARATLGLGTIATQSAGAVAITGGSIAGITDLALADGGTGASSAGAARNNLGLAIGSDVQAFHANLTAFGGLGLIADRLPYANGAGSLALATFTAAGRTVAAAAGVTGTGNVAFSASPTFTGTITAAAVAATSLTAQGTTSSARIVVKKTDGTAGQMRVNYIGYQDLAGNEHGFVGFAASGADTLHLWNSLGATQVNAATGYTISLRVNNMEVAAASATGLNLAGTLSVAGTQVAAARRTGWTAPSGTATRAGFATGTASTQQVAEALKALIDDLVAHGLIGS